MRYPYSEAFSPPAPVFPLEVFTPDAPQQRLQVDAKLDTAADISAIPSEVLDKLALEAVSEILVSGYDAEAELLPTYAVGLELSEARIRTIEVIAIPEPYVLLGRDALNYFYVHLNGPELTFDLDLSP
jgi:hypothetical protein